MESCAGLCVDVVSSPSSISEFFLDTLHEPRFMKCIVFLVTKGRAAPTSVMGRSWGCVLRNPDPSSSEVGVGYTNSKTYMSWKENLP